MNVDARRGGRGPPRGRPPPKRTYGSNQGSRQNVREGERQRGARVDNSSVLSAAPSTTLGGINSNLLLSHQLATPTLPLQPDQRDGRLNASEVISDGGSQSARKFGGGAGSGVCSAEEVSKLVRKAREGGEGGRLSAITVAQACKSRETRKALRINASDILGELTSVMLESLCQHRDEAIVHGLAVAMFVLSKDRVLVKAFSASAVSTLAMLIDGRREEDSGEGNSTLGRSICDDTGVSRPPVTSEKHSSRSSPSWGMSIDFSSFDMIEGEGDAPVGVGRGFGVDKAFGGDKAGGRVLPEDGRASNNRTNLKHVIASRPNGHVSTNMMVRARMLLDIADMVPWGMANRHLVSAADLGLATLLNVVSEACVESGGAVGTGGESVDEELSTQGSLASQSEPTSLLSALGDGRGDSGEAIAAHNAGVMSEFTRRAPTVFLLPLVVGGTTVLGDLSVRVSNYGMYAASVAGATDAAASPSSLRSVHQLLLALRLLDLATLESAGVEVGAATTVTNDPGPNPCLSNRRAELTGALLLVVDRCLPLCGDPAQVSAAGYEKGSTPASGRLRAGQKRQSLPVAMGKEVASKVHECLLAALRVLINVTHHDARTCGELASRGGLGTLMSCLVERSFCGNGRLSSCGSGNPTTAPARSDLAILEDTSVNVADEDLQGSGLEQYCPPSGGGVDAEGDFDAQVLSISALINCVELKESADNCTAMASLAVFPPSAPVTGGRTFGESISKHHKQQERQRPSTADGLFSSRCLAPEFLAKLLARCTQSFAHQLGGDRADEDVGEEAASPAPDRARQPVKGTLNNSSRGGDDSSKSLAEPVKERSRNSDASMEAQEGQNTEEHLMSHAEGTHLVLGGHCALLLGLLVREQESNRRLVLPLLPDGDPTLIIRVLEAFMALQFQAGVLTEEMVLAVQGLVEELEGLEAMQVDECHPSGRGAPDEAVAAAADLAPTGAAPTSPDAVTTASSQRDRKRLRDYSPADTCLRPNVERDSEGPKLGREAKEALGESGGADELLTSSKRFRTDVARDRQMASLRMGQTPAGQTTPPSKCSKPRAVYSSPPTQAAREEQNPTGTPRNDLGGGESRNTPLSGNLTPRSSKPPSPSFLAGAASIARRITMGIRGRRSATGTRNWLGGSPPQLQTYGSRAWKRNLSKPVAEHQSSFTFQDSGKGKEGAAGRRAQKPSVNCFEILSDDSEGETEMNFPRLPGRYNAGGGSGGGGVERAGIGPKSGQSVEVLPPSAKSSSFDVDDWSDSSNETPAKGKGNGNVNGKQEEKTKSTGASFTAGQVRSSVCRRGGCAGSSSSGGGSGGSGGGSDNPTAAQDANERRRKRSQSPSPPPRAAVREVEKYCGPLRKVGSGKGGLASRASVANAAGTRPVVWQRPGQANGGLSSRPPLGRSSKSKQVDRRNVDVRQQQPSTPGLLALQQQPSSSAVKGMAASQAPGRHDGGASVQSRVGGFKENPAPTRRALEAGGVGKGRPVKPAHFNVFEIRDDDDEFD